MKNISIILVALLTFSSCLPEPLEIEIEPFETQTVVFSQVVPDNFISVVLTRTLDALEFNQEEGDSLTENILDDLLVRGAFVSVSYQQDRVSLFPAAPGVYASFDLPLLVGVDYTLNIITPEGENLSATNTMLPQVEFESLQPEIQRNTSDTLVSVNYRIPASTEDHWYLLNFYTDRYEDANGEQGLDSVFADEGSFLKATRLIESQAFGGQDIDGQIELPTVNARDSLFVTLSNISEDYYRFLETRATASNFFTEVIKEPVNSPSNVEGGLGFFNLHFPSILEFDLEEY